jgi:hypothetical protein
MGDCSPPNSKRLAVMVRHSKTIHHVAAEAMAIEADALLPDGTQATRSQNERSGYDSWS